MGNEYWKEQENKFLQALVNIEIPNDSLDNVDFLVIKTQQDLLHIPATGGCYWIWTNEPVQHSLHKNVTPSRFDRGEIIYNGIAKDNVRDRVNHHLFGHVDAGWSGISMDIYFGETISHRKKALSEKGKVPYIEETFVYKRAVSSKGISKGDEFKAFKAIRKKDDFLKLHLSEEEKKIIESENANRLFFRNGINITEKKHENFEFRVYHITGLSSLYLDYIEKKWRSVYGLPKLCSYSSGR